MYGEINAETSKTEELKVSTEFQIKDSSTITEILKCAVKRSLLNGGVSCE